MANRDELMQRLERLEALATSLSDGFVGSDTVTAKSYWVLDGAGRRRAEFGMFDGVVALLQRDVSGTTRAAIGVYDDGRPHLRLMDAEGRVRLGAKLESDGSPVLQLLDASRKARINIVEKDGTPQLALLDANGRPRVLVMVPPEGDPVMVQLGADGREID